MPEIVPLHPAPAAPGDDDGPACAGARRLLESAPHDSYDALATQIQRENEVINHRLTWTLQLNGFLFTATALLGPREPLPPAVGLFVHWLIPLTGACVSLAGLLGVVAANLQLLYLRRFWAGLGLADRPRPFGDVRNAYLLGAVPAVLPPAVLATVWVGFLVLAFTLR
jgi:hypothetical protein